MTSPDPSRERAGWKLVPVEPTAEMISAAMPAPTEWIGHQDASQETIARWREGHGQAATRHYAAMLAAAPSPAALLSQTSGAWEWRSRLKGGAWDAWEQGRFGQEIPPFADVQERWTGPAALAKPASAGGGVREKVRWLVEETLPSGSVCWKCYEHEHQAKTIVEASNGRCTLTRLSSPAPSPAEAKAMEEALPEAVREAWSFLRDRLLEFEQEIGSGEEEREWVGHVMPALSRFGSLIAALSASVPAQEEQADA